MVPLSNTLSDLWSRFQGHNIFEVEYLKYLRDNITIAHKQETIPNTSNGTMFGDLDWLLANDW